MSGSQTSHFDAFYTLLPSSLKAGIDDLLSGATRESTVKYTLDQLVRFSSGIDPIDEDLDSREEWNIQQHKAIELLSGLHPNADHKGKKRVREEDESASAELAKDSKRAKLDANSSGKVDEDPLFTLHSVSVSSPVRKKVNVTIYRKDIVGFTHPTSGIQEASLSLSSLSRAFLLPTPGKSKPHWTIVILAESEQNQIIFGLDAIPPSITTTTHPEPPRNYPKGTESYSILKLFLSHLPPHIQYQEPSTKHFISPAGDSYLDAYLRAKDGHLFFFEDGLFFGEKKPCLWIPMNRIENVRSLSATGRTFSLFVVEVADEEAEDGEETEFSLIDGKNQDAVALWVGNNRSRFGVDTKSKRADRGVADEEDESEGSEDRLVEKKVDENSEDSDDSDFESDSGSDGGSETSQSSGEEGEQERSEAEEGEAEEESDGDEDDKALSPSNHPLLRPGAMPRMSNAAINAVVGMMEEDLADVVRGNVESEEFDELED